MCHPDFAHFAIGAIQLATRSQPYCNLGEIRRQTRGPKSSDMNIPVRQVPSWMGRSADRATSPVVLDSPLHLSGTAGTAVRLATAKAPDGAGSVAAAGHVVAPALSCDGPGLISVGDRRPERLPDSDTNRCYPAHRRPGRARHDAPAGAHGILFPTGPGRPAPERYLGDRPRRTVADCSAGARSGFGRAVSLSSEPASQNRRFARTLRRFVALARS